MSPPARGMSTAHTAPSAQWPMPRSAGPVSIRSSLPTSRRNCVHPKDIAVREFPRPGLIRLVSPAVNFVGYRWSRSTSPRSAAPAAGEFSSALVRGNSTETKPKTKSEPRRHHPLQRHGNSSRHKGLIIENHKINVTRNSRRLTAAGGYTLLFRRSLTAGYRHC